MTDTRLESPMASGWMPSRHLWAVHLGVLTVLLAILLAVNWTLVTAALTVWAVSPTYSHCYFIIPVSAFLIWKRRHVVAPLVPAPLPSALLLAIPCILVQLAGSIASITEVQQIAMMGLVEVLILAVLGPEIFTHLMFPLLFLFFLVPMGEYLVGPMQNFTTWFISTGLDLMGILHHTEGTIIEMTNGVYRVAEACAGLRFLIATLAVGALFAYLTYRKWHKIVLYMLACVIVPIIANGFRALGIVLLAHYSDNKIATGADHLVYGWGFSVAILCLLMVIGVRFADPISDDETRAAKPSVAGKLSQRLIPTAILAGLCAFAVPAFAYWNAHRSVSFDRGALSLPHPSNGWLIKQASGNWQPDFVEPDAKLTFGLQAPEPQTPAVDIAVDYYAKSREGHGLISSGNRFWDDEGSHVLSENAITTHWGNTPIVLREMVIATQSRTEMIWWTYWANDRFTTSATQIKLGSLQSMLGGASGTALVALSTEMDSDEDSARSRLAAAMAALSGLPPQLRQAAGLSQDR
jgi:exosortase A